MFRKVVKYSKEFIPGVREHLKTIPDIVLIVALGSLAMVVFTYNNTHEQLWYDETLSMYFSEMRFDEMIQVISDSGAEHNPPLHHILLKITRSVFGNSIFIARSLSGLLGSLFIVAFYLNVQKLFSRPVALISSLITMFNPVIIHYSQDIRMYMLATLLLCISQFSFIFAIKEKRKKYWILYTVSCTAGIYTHNYLLFPLIANGIFFIFTIIQSLKKSVLEYKPIVWYVVSHAVIVLVYMPWFPSVLKQSNQLLMAQWTEPVTSDILFKIVSYFFTSKFSLDVNPIISCQIMATIITFFLSLVIYHRFRIKIFDEKVVFLLGTIFIPILIILTYSLTSHSIINFRNFIPYFPFLSVLVASGILLLGKKQLVVLVSLIVITVNVPTMYNLYTKKFNGSGGETAEYIKKNNTVDDPVITFEGSSFLTIYYYLHKPHNLYFYSDDTLPECFGTSLYSSHVINNEKLVEMLNNKTSFWMVITPWTKEYPTEHLNNILRTFSADESVEKKFVYEHSWFRTKVIKYVKNDSDS